jgi:predicted TIM-barrel fold metal-dependent hydrolase
MSIEEYEPVSSLVVPGHPIERARYPFVDVHAHFFRAPTMSAGAVDTVVKEMDGMNMVAAVNLSGGSGERLVASVAGLNERYPGRFVTFANINFEGIDDPDWGQRTADGLEDDVRNGAAGLKIYKNLGLTAVDGRGVRIPVDDPRIDPVWAACGELGIPVLIHSGEPSPFFNPKDRFNERWLELKQRPERYRPPEQYPTWEEIMAEQHNVFRKHPETTFINAHLGWLGNDLDRLGRLLDELPNVYTEVGAVLAELGRQPRHARAFLVEHSDRVLFGKDSWAPDEYRVYFRAFETADEYFDYYRKRHAHWKIYGMDLPDDVLRDVYYRNALRIIPGLDPSMFPAD